MPAPSDSQQDIPIQEREREGDPPFGDSHRDRNSLFWNHYQMAELFRVEDEFDDANSHIERAKSLAVGDEYTLGRGMEAQARIWYRQGRVEDARSETLGALEVFERLGAATAVRDCRDLLGGIGDSTGELLETMGTSYA